jgi:anti-sigma-K factor RskA
MNGEIPTSGDNERGERDAAALGRFAGTLRSGVVWSAPPDDLADRIIAQVNALRNGDGHAGESSEPVPSPAIDIEVARGRRIGAPWRWAAIAAAAALAFAAGALLVGNGGGNDNRERDAVADVELAPTELGAGASAAGTIVDAGAGYSISIHVAGLPPAPEGEYYEGWLHDAETGDWVSVGTFHMRSGDSRVVLWSGVSIWRYAELVVTTEVEGSSGGRGDILLAGQVEQR